MPIPIPARIRELNTQVCTPFAPMPVLILNFECYVCNMFIIIHAKKTYMANH